MKIQFATPALRLLCGGLALTFFFCLTGQDATAKGMKKTIAKLFKCTEITPEQCPALLKAQKSPAEASALLIPMLKDRDPKKRITSAEALRFFPGEEPLTRLLIAYANERRKEVVKAMDENLNLVPRQKILDTTRALIRADNVGKRTLACVIIGKRHLHEFARLLIQASEDTSRRVQHAAIRSMAEVGTPSIDIPLMQIAGNTSKDWTLRQQALMALSRLKAKEALPIALLLSGHQQAQLRRAAMSVIGELEAVYGFQALIGGLGDAQTAGPAAMALGKLKRSIAAPFAVNALAFKKITPSDKAKILWGIGMMKNPSVLPALFDQLKDAPPETATSILQAVGHIGSVEAMPDLIPMLESSDPGIRDMCEWAMETITGQRLGPRMGPWWAWLKANPNTPPENP